MPYYQYQCKDCSEQWSEYHEYGEVATLCPSCKQENIRKVYNYTTTINKLTEAMEHKNSKVGQKTRNFIEEAKRDLKEQKETMRGE
jgi:putative FmdB family regulatory protein